MTLLRYIDSVGDDLGTSASTIAGVNYGDVFQFADYLALDPVTAELSLAEINVAVLANNALFEVLVNVTDGGGLTAQCAVTVSISAANVGPTLSSAKGSSSYSIEENAVAGLISNGPGGGVLTAEDCSPASEDQHLSWTISACTIVGSGAACGNHKNMFALNLLDDGVIQPNECTAYKAELKYTGSPTMNYEANKFAFLGTSAAEAHAYRIMITVEDDDDATPLSATAAIQVNVTDVPEPPTMRSVAWSIYEDAPVGTVAGRLGDLAADEDYYDLATTRTFEIVNVSAVGVRRDLALRSFEIRGNETVLGHALDYENCSSYALSVRVTDTTGLQATGVVTVNVLDVNEAPRIKRAQRVFVDEDASVGSVVGTVSVKDPDTGVSPLVYHLNATGTEVGNATVSIDVHRRAHAPRAARFRNAPRVRVLGARGGLARPLRRGDRDGRGRGRERLDGLGHRRPDARRQAQHARRRRRHVLRHQLWLGPERFDYDDASEGTEVHVTAEYSNGVDGQLYVATSCSVVVPNTVINCTAGPGVGYGHIWSLYVDATAGGAAPSGR